MNIPIYLNHIEIFYFITSEAVNRPYQYDEKLQVPSTNKSNCKLKHPKKKAETNNQICIKKFI